MSKLSPGWKSWMPWVVVHFRNGGRTTIFLFSFWSIGKLLTFFNHLIVISCKVFVILSVFGDWLPCGWLYIDFIKHCNCHTLFFVFIRHLENVPQLPAFPASISHCTFSNQIDPYSMVVDLQEPLLQYFHILSFGKTESLHILKVENWHSFTYLIYYEFTSLDKRIDKRLFKYNKP